MPKVVLDENVSFQVAGCLADLGYEVLAIVKHPQRGMNDQMVFDLVVSGKSILLTRDGHFTNPIRFPAAKTGGIIYLTHGNLRASAEVALVDQFLKSHAKEIFEGRLVLLSPRDVRIR